MTNRYFIFLKYKGTTYHGWQLQPRSLTIQEVVDKALSTILNCKTLTTGAGRTDTGVHARFFAAHFDSDRNDLSENNNIISRLNKFLPSDISVMGIRQVIPEAHARFSAISRTYKYYISKTKDPFHSDLSWFSYSIPDMEPMNEAAALLLDYDDFTSFARLHSDVKTNICKVTHAEWKEGNNMLVFTIRADRFLRNMVRAIVGTLVDVGLKKYDSERFRMIIEAKDRGMAGKSAPAKGLFLEAIEYPENIFPESQGRSGSFHISQDLSACT